MNRRWEKTFTAYFSNNILTKLVADSNSGVEVTTTKKHITLYPYHLQNVKNSIHELLNKFVGTYQDDLDGHLLAYKNVKILSDLSPCVADTCFIHLDLEADFFIFKPKLGDILPATVVKFSEDHVGALIYNTFNVSIPKPENEINWVGSTVDIGNDIEIKIKKLDLLPTIPYILGVFVNTYSEDSGISACEDTVTLDNTEQDNMKVSKKKKTKIKETEDLENEIDEEFSSPQTKRKKSKKATVDVEETKELSQISLDEDISNEKSLKKKKRKRELEEHSDEGEIVHKKKKSKKAEIEI